MPIFAQVSALLSAGKGDAAAAALLAAAASGDEEAMFGLANWRLFGLHGPRDLAAVHRLLAGAADASHPHAVRMLACLTANGTGCLEDPDRAAELLAKISDRDSNAATQLQLYSNMPSAEEICGLPSETIAEAPMIRCIRGLLSEAECEYVAAAAAPELRPSLVIDPITGLQVPNPIRTSAGMSFGPSQEDLVIRQINRRIAAVTGTQVSQGEPLHVLHYQQGQQYRAHVDTLGDTTNQRHWTALLYLNDGYAGGQTRFEAPGVVFTGHRGDALIFRNVDEQEKPDPKSRHAGLPVTSGTKWLATRWIRKFDHDPWEVH